VNAPLPVSRWHSVLGVALVGMGFRLAISGVWLPSVKPSGIPLDQFSAERAARSLQRILGDQVPHPMGTEANFAVRDRVVEQFRELGYDPQVKSEWAGLTRLAMVQNIVSTLPGIDPGSAVLVSAHYDSAPAGPGAADDGLGVAVVIEVARALKNRAPLRNSITFLISDGEEFGWLGAAEFARQHPRGHPYRAVVTLDGNEGTAPVWISDTGHENAWLAPILARGIAHPLMLLNPLNPPRPLEASGGDFQIYRDQDWAGFELAFRDRLLTYHTPRDRIDHLDWRVAQQGGDLMLSLVGALAQEDLSHPTPGRVAMMDLLGRRVLYWPVTWNYVVLITAVGAFGLAVFRLSVLGRLNGKKAGRCALAWLFMAGVDGILSVGFWLCPVSLEPWATVVMWIAVVVVAFAAFLSLSPPAATWETWIVTLAVVLIAGVVVCTVATAAGHTLLAPVIAGSAGALWAASRPANAWTIMVAVMLPVVSLEIFWAYLLLFGIEAELPGSLGLILLSGPMLCLAPELSRRTLLMMTGLATIVGGMALVAGQSRNPGRCSIRYFLDANLGLAEWQLFTETGTTTGLPKFETADFGRRSSLQKRWDNAPALAASTAPISLDPAELRIIESIQDHGKWTIRAHFQSSRTPSVGAVMFPPEAHLERVEAMGRVQRPTIWANGWLAAYIQTMPVGGLDVKFILAPTGPVAVDLVNFVYGLPETGRLLERERSRSAVPSNIGDITMVSKTIELIGP
jgi:Peptidase family M28